LSTYTLNGLKISAFSSIVLTLALSGCSSNPSPTSPSNQQNASTDRASRIAELQVVDCLLPGQVRMLGNRSYVTPRRPATLTAAECQIRGGEYVAYDRADFKTSLNVWMPTAEQGDADAQVNVGEIFEKGAGGTPNYQAALIWYNKAAEQGNKRAQFNLGTLYEQGLGVEKDAVAALEWYRKAWGLPADSIVYQSAAAEEEKNRLKEINKTIRKKDLQISAMKQQLAALSSQLKQQNNIELKEQLNELTSIVAELEQESTTAKAEKVTLVAKADGYKLRMPIRQAEKVQFTNTGADVTVGDINFGKYYALVIGVQDYQNIEDLDTPVNDINQVADILTNQYGFEVRKVSDADDVGIMEAINDINDQLTDQDNLLIFYAGHGARLTTGDLVSGYWLPVNAEAPPRDTYWVANEFLTRHLARFDAKRVMVVADSCYAGLLSSAPGYLMLGNNEVDEEYIKYKAGKRSRLLLASGGDKPVLDGVGGNHSIFTQAFVDVLKNNKQILTGPQLFKQLRQQVIDSADEVNFSQNPEYKTIKGAGHEVGDFFFIPKTTI
jgi:uncharacterized glyoxalase superfamily protein PhnB